MSISGRIEYLKSLFKGKTNNSFLQLFRYTFVGGLAFLVDFGLLIMLTEYFHIYYLLSAGIAFVFGLIVNYYLSINWVFNSRVVENKLFEFLVFTLIGIVGLGLNELFLWLLTDKLLFYYIFSKAITTFIVYFWNFFARKLLLFNQHKNNHE
ncbi:MAG: GtrA family protein [Paludibacter sp.]|nr:GtrA family protein [Paludibacter sp.]